MRDAQTLPRQEEFALSMAGSVFTKGAAMKDAITLSYKEVSALVMEQREELAVMEDALTIASEEEFASGMGRIS